jgi:hypothetical protein
VKSPSTIDDSELSAVDARLQAVVCRSCGSAGQQNYCPVCGQRRTQGRHTLRRFASGVVSRVVGEKGIVRTAFLLTTAPDRVVRDYWAGNTVGYVNPVGYLMLAAAAFVLIGRLISGSTGAAETDRILLLFVIPFVAAASRVFCWRWPCNAAEHLILVTYLGAHVVALLTILHVGLIAVPSSLMPAYALGALVSGLLYYIWAYSKVMEGRRHLAVLAGILSLVLGTAVWSAFLVAIVGLLRS